MAVHWVAGSIPDWLQPDQSGRLTGGVRIDPYFVWAQMTDFVDLGGVPNSWFPVAIELTRAGADGNAVSAADFAAQIKSEHWGDWIRMSSLYSDPLASLAAARFCTAEVTLVFFSKAYGLLDGLIERFTLGSPVVSGGTARTDHAPSSVWSAAPGAQANASGADLVVAPVIGICDDGFAFAHERFHATPDGRATRVECFWNQDDPANSAQGLGYGRELRKAELDEYMRRARRGAAVDEEAVYRLAGYTGVRRRWAHGTAMMDLACGEDPPQLNSPADGSPVARIICVQFRLPERNIRDTSGLWIDVLALDALRYVVTRARDIGGEACPVVVNLSYGYIAGPHDGSSMLEAAIDELIELSGCAVILPAGNSNLSRCHARLLMESGETNHVLWRLLPDSRTPSFLQIWLRAEEPEPDFSLQICSPSGGEASPWISRGDVFTWTPNRTTVCTVVYVPHSATGDGPMILVALAPTATFDPTRDVAAAGNWTISLRNAGTKQLIADAWIQRNETPDGFPFRGRQSRFEDSQYERFDAIGRPLDYDEDDASWIRRSGTLNSLATGRKTVVTSGFYRTDGTIARYSASGPLSAMGPANIAYRSGPDVAAVSEDSVVCEGVLAAGTRSGSILAVTGTSASTPQVARWLARNGTGADGRFASPRDMVRRYAKKTEPTLPLQMHFTTPDPRVQKRDAAPDSAGAGRVLFPPLIDRKLQGS